MQQFDKFKYNAKFNKDNYKRISFYFSKEDIKTANGIANAHGYDTINAYAKALLEAALAGKLEIKENN